MRVSSNSEVRRDFEEAIAYYEAEASIATVVKFTNEFRRLLREIGSRPLSFTKYGKDMRKAPLHRFPYHILFSIQPHAGRLLVLRHNKRHPSYGTRRR